MVCTANIKVVLSLVILMAIITLWIIYRDTTSFARANNVSTKTENMADGEDTTTGSATSDANTPSVPELDCSGMKMYTVECIQQQPLIPGISFFSSIICSCVSCLFVLIIGFVVFKQTSKKS